MITLISLIHDLDHLLPQLAHFISEFNELEVIYNINIIADNVGNLDIDAPASICDDCLSYTQRKVSVLDRLINTQGAKASELIDRAIEMERRNKLDNPNYRPRMGSRIQEFARLQNAFKR